MARLIGTLGLAIAMSLTLGSTAAQEIYKKVDVDAAFKKLDTNNDNKLSKDEFVKLADSFKDKAKAREKLAAAFDKIDPQNAGLTKDQFRKHLEMVTAKKKDKTP